MYADRPTAYAITKNTALTQIHKHYEDVGWNDRRTVALWCLPADSGGANPTSDNIIFTDTFQPKSPFVIATAHRYFFTYYFIYIVVYHLLSLVQINKCCLDHGRKCQVNKIRPP